MVLGAREVQHWLQMTEVELRNLVVFYSFLYDYKNVLLF